MSKFRSGATDFIAQERESRVWSVIARLVTSPYGLLLAFVWGFTEALSWFIVAEMALILFAAAVPRRVMPWAAAVIVGSVLGVLTNAWLTSRGTLLPAPLTTPRMAATAFGQLAAGPSAMMHQALSGIPVKVYARAAGEHHIELWNLGPLDAAGAWTADLGGRTGGLAPVSPVSSFAATAFRRLPGYCDRRFHRRAVGGDRRVVIA